MGHFSTPGFIWGLLLLLVAQFPYSEAKQPDFCRLEPDHSRCMAAFRRFYFNTITNDCQLFIFGGCGGNANNFWSADECFHKCICTQDVDIGNKKGHSCHPQLNFYYDSSSHTCRPFHYQGCGGNRNRFVSRRRCFRTCSYYTTY